MALHKLSAAEQTAAHLKDWLLNKNATNQIPGVDRLSLELGVSRDTVRRALVLLEKSGLIRSGGKGKPRVIVNDSALDGEQPTKSKALRVNIFPDMNMEHFASYLVTHALQLQRQLTDAGCNCQFTDRTLADFDHQPQRISRYVAANEADVWIVMAASSDVLEWFEKQSFVTIAWGGRHRHLSLPGSGTNLVPAIREATRHLISLGHRRIAYLAPPIIRQPSISTSGQAFLEELNTRGVSAASSYHLPEFSSDPHGIEVALKEMFRVTPPTALIVGMHSYHLTVLSFLRQNNLRVPEDVSIVAGYMDAKLDWMFPRQAHFHLQMDKIIRRIVKWIEDVIRGKRPDGCAIYDAAYFSGPSVGPVPR
jgi:DNA-binding LacI/PurR family transcriptional regulator